MFFKPQPLSDFSRLRAVKWMRRVLIERQGQALDVEHSAVKLRLERMGISLEE